MKYKVTLNGKQYEVDVEQGQATAVYTGSAQTEPAPAPAAEPVAQAPEKAAAPAPASAAPAGDGAPVASPMPGAIIDVRCQVGQRVKSGDILFLLEAMKMENEIAAPGDGVITAVNVTKGAAVDTGSVLCTLK